MVLINIGVRSHLVSLSQFSFIVALENTHMILSSLSVKLKGPYVDIIVHAHREVKNTKSALRECRSNIVSFP